MNILSFGEVPHSYVTVNPKKEVQKVETFKQRDKAELNLSVTKLKTKELEGKLVNGKLVFDITDKKDIQEGNILVTQGTPYKPNSARVRSTNPIQILEANKETNRLEVTGKNLKDVYINVLDNKGQLTGIYKNIKIIQPKEWKNYYSINIEISDEYEGGYMRLSDWRPVLPKGVRLLSTSGNNLVYLGIIATIKFEDNVNPSILNKFEINGLDKLNGGTWFQNKVKDVIDTETIISYFYEDYGYPFLRLQFDKMSQKDFSIKFVFNSSGTYIYDYSCGSENSGNCSERRNYKDMEDHITLNVKFKATTLKGNSTLTFAEYYPVNEFVQFTSNPTIQNAQPLALDNSVRDVSFETTGKGLVAMQQGDKLTIDGHQVIIGAGGNIEPQKLTIGNVKYTYEVKNGKFRIALNEWGVLEPNKTIPIKIVRNENGKDKSLAEHNLTIKAPRKVAGTSNLKLNQDYDIRSIIRFNGINLETPSSLSLENPVPLGVILTGISGQGIPFMKEEDILQIDDGLTRAVKSFTVGSNGNLAKQKVRLNNGELSLFVEGGKLRVGVDNWLVNKSISSRIRVLRGTNEIANHMLDIKAPEAPFNIKKNGLLDFGNVTAGTKRIAETDIVLEMLKDVSDIEFSLKDSQPILENLGTGNTLTVNRIEYLVSKQGAREYRIKLKGNLTIPKATKSGLYTGSTVLELKLK